MLKCLDISLRTWIALGDMYDLCRPCSERLQRPFLGWNPYQQQRRKTWWMSIFQLLQVRPGVELLQVHRGVRARACQNSISLDIAIGLCRLKHVVACSVRILVNADLTATSMQLHGPAIWRADMHQAIAMRGTIAIETLFCYNPQSIVDQNL